MQAKEKGWIGLVILANWMIPLTNKSADLAATERTNDFMLGWSAYFFDSEFSS
jgi:hypothetical protein